MSHFSRGIRRPYQLSRGRRQRAVMLLPRPQLFLHVAFGDDLVAELLFAGTQRFLHLRAPGSITFPAGSQGFLQLGFRRTQNIQTVLTRA